MLTPIVPTQASRTREGRRCCWDSSFYRRTYRFWLYFLPVWHVDRSRPRGRVVRLTVASLSALQGDQFATTTPSCCVFGGIIGVAGMLILMFVEENEEAEEEEARQKEAAKEEGNSNKGNSKKKR